MAEISRSKIFRDQMRRKADTAKKDQQQPQTKRVGDRPFTGMKEDKNKGEER